MLTKRYKKWYIVKQVNGKKKWIATGKEDRNEAEMLERAMNLIKDGQKDKFVKLVAALYDDAPALDRIAMPDLMEEYPRIAKALGVRVSNETMRKRRNALGRLAAWCKAHTKGVAFADDVTIPIAWRFIDAVGDKATAGTQRKVAGELSTVWESLLKRGLVTDNPWKSAKPQKDASTERHGRAFTFDEIRAILGACAYDWQRHAVVIGLYTGLRLGDIFSLRWENIDFEEGVIRRFKPSKTAKHDIEVCIPLHDSLKAYLTPLRASEGRIVEATCSSDHFGEYYFTSIIERAGILADKRTKLSFHCLRHTFATLLAQSGATEQERMRLGGWTSAATAQIYNHDDSKDRKIIASLPSL